MGDKTELASVAMVAHAKIPMKLVHPVAAAIFTLLGIATLPGAGAQLGV